MKHLFISHSHEDHSGCYNTIIKKTNVENFYIKNNIIDYEKPNYDAIITNAKKSDPNIKIHYINKGIKPIDFGELKLFVLNQKNVFEKKGTKCNNMINVLKFSKNPNEKFKINNKNVCIKGINPTGLNYGDDCSGTDVYYAYAIQRYACNDNSNSAALLVKIPYYNGKAKGSRFAYLSGDLDNNGYPVYGINGHYGAGVTYAIKVKNNKIIEDKENNIKVLAETKTAKQIATLFGKKKINLNNITIYQQSHHGFDNALDALNVLKFTQVRDANHKLFSIATYKYDQDSKTGINTFYPYASYNKLHNETENRVVMSTGKATDYISCSINSEGITNCENH